VDGRAAERNADDFVAGMAASLRPAGVRMKRVGAVELASIHGVQVVRFEVAADPRREGGALAPIDHTIVALVVADDCAYAVQYQGPSAHAWELRDVADASLRTVQAAPARGSQAYRAGTTVVRVAAVAFLVFVAIAACFWFMRRSRGK
jgi:hypothetical protein